MEGCVSFRAWYDMHTGRTFLRPRKGQCLHYYFYFVDEELGLCHLCVPTWAPFPLRFYFNGHEWLACRMRAEDIAFTLIDNAFTDIDDFAAAQRLADTFLPDLLHKKLDHYAKRFCPVIERFPLGVHWSIKQVEYATDILWCSPDALAPLYDALVRTAVHAVKADDVATFLGRPLSRLYRGDLGGNFNVRIQGSRVRHYMGAASIKMYDKFGRMLRLESTTHDVAFFKHRRKVEHRDGTSSMKIAPVKKTIYSLGVLAELLGAANRRYLKFLSALDDPSAGIQAVERVARPVRHNERSYRGFNLFDGIDLDLFVAIARGEFTISGLRNRNLVQALGRTSAQVSRMLKRLRVHGLVKKIGRTYKYYVTELGRRILAAALRLREEVVVPTLTVARPAERFQLLES